MKFILLVLCSVFLMGCSPYVSEKEQNFPTKVSDSASLDSANDPLLLSSLFFDNIAYERMSGWKMVYSDEARASYLHPNFIEKEGPIHNALMVNVYHEQSPFIIQSIYELDCSTLNRMKVEQMKWDYASKISNTKPLRAKKVEWESYPEFSMAASVWSDVCQHPEHLLLNRAPSTTSLTFGASATQSPGSIPQLWKHEQP